MSGREGQRGLGRNAAYAVVAESKDVALTGERERAVRNAAYAVVQRYSHGVGAATWKIERWKSLGGVGGGGVGGGSWREVSVSEMASTAAIEFATLKNTCRCLSIDARVLVFGSLGVRFRLAKYGVISGSLIQVVEEFCVGTEPVPEPTGWHCEASGAGGGGGGAGGGDGTPVIRRGTLAEEVERVVRMVLTDR